ncbi:ABC transporter permease subunit [bacterium]|nr:ABC transporter permease subunit [bacterium]
MILSVALKEFYTNLISARFTIGFLLCLFLIPFTMVVSINDYESQVRAYELEKKQADENNKIRVYSALRPEIVRPPEPLSIFSRGISYKVGNKVTTRLGEKTLLAEGRSSVRENPLLNSFFSLDFSTVITIIMSLLALLFTYDACSREREEGTLKLVLSNPVNRWKILLGKVIGILITMMPVILFCYGLSAVIILFHPHLEFSAHEWGRIVFMFGLSIVFFTFFAALGLLVSARTHSSVTSIIICLFIWVAAVFVVPNASVYVAKSFIATESQENLRYALNDLDRNFSTKVREYRQTLDQPDWWMNWNMNSYGDGYMEVSGNTRSLMELYRKLCQYSEPLRIQYADEKWAIQKAYLDKLDRQRLFAEWLSLLSPSEMFRQSVSAMCRTDVPAHYHFLDKAREYREELIQFFRDKDMFASYEYFTRQDPKTFMTADEIVRIRTGGEFKTLREYGEWAQLHNGDFKPLRKVDIPGTDLWKYEPLDLSGVPQFRWESSTFAYDVNNSLIRLALLLLGDVILFYLAFISFIRYDVR